MAHIHHQTVLCKQSFRVFTIFSLTTYSVNLICDNINLIFNTFQLGTDSKIPENYCHIYCYRWAFWANQHHKINNIVLEFIFKRMHIRTNEMRVFVGNHPVKRIIYTLWLRAILSLVISYYYSYKKSLKIFYNCKSASFLQLLVTLKMGAYIFWFTLFICTYTYYFLWPWQMYCEYRYVYNWCLLNLCFFSYNTCTSGTSEIAKSKSTTQFLYKIKKKMFVFIYVLNYIFIYAYITFINTKWESAT